VAVRAAIVLFFVDAEAALGCRRAGGAHGDRHDQKRGASFHHVDPLSGSGDLHSNVGWIAWELGRAVVGLVGRDSGAGRNGGLAARKGERDSSEKN